MDKTLGHNVEHKKTATETVRSMIPFIWSKKLCTSKTIY